MRVRTFIAAVILAMVFAHPLTGFAQTPTTKPARDFNLQCYHDFAAAAKGNFICSPYSAQTTVAVLEAGAGGDTAAQLRAALCLPDGKLFKPDSIQRVEIKPPHHDEKDESHFGLQRSDFNTSNFSGLSIGTLCRAWAAPGTEFLPEFSKRITSDFFADTGTVDFAKPTETAKTINAWAAEKSGGVLDKMFDAGDINSDTRLAITSGVFFQSRWDSYFDKHATKPGDFHIDGGAGAKVPMMHAADEYEGYFQEDGCTVVSKKYKNDGAAFVLIVPDATDGLPAIESKLTAEKIHRWATSLNGAKVNLTMPKFSFRSHCDMGSMLHAAGVVDAFNPTLADFSKMAKPDPAHPVYLDRINQFATIDLDEEGTSARALSVVMFLGVGVDKEKVVHQVVADRPFMFMIVDLRSKAILFMGRVSDPR